MLPKNFNPTLGRVKPKIALRDPQLHFNMFTKRFEYGCCLRPFEPYVTIAVQQPHSLKS